MKRYDYEDAPKINGKLKTHFFKMPPIIQNASGININGRLIKSLVFTTDIAIVRNCDADAIFCVYPFTPQSVISNAIINASYVPVFCGVGGGTTKGIRTISLAKEAESQGAMGVVLNAPISDLNLVAITSAVDIPVVITIANEKTNIKNRMECGASILNVACAENTPEVVRRIRTEFSDIPIIASGGKSESSIKETIKAGANAITYTPPSARELFSELMAEYRENN